MTRKKFTTDEQQERYIRLEEANLEPLPIIEKIKEMEKQDDLTCKRDKCRCKSRNGLAAELNQDSNKTYRED